MWDWIKVQEVWNESTLLNTIKFMQGLILHTNLNFKHPSRNIFRTSSKHLL